MPACVGNDTSAMKTADNQKYGCVTLRILASVSSKLNKTEKERIFSLDFFGRA